jgi:hypothetical protein
MVGLIIAIYWLVRRRLNSVECGLVSCTVVTNDDLPFFVAKCQNQQHLRVLSNSAVHGGGGGGGYSTPPPEFPSFEKAEPNSQFHGIYIHNNVIRIWVQFICKLNGTPD